MGARSPSSLETHVFSRPPKSVAAEGCWLSVSAGILLIPIDQGAKRDPNPSSDLNLPF